MRKTSEETTLSREAQRHKLSFLVTFVQLTCLSLSPCSFPANVSFFVAVLKSVSCLSPGTSLPEVVLFPLLECSELLWCSRFFDTLPDFTCTFLCGLQIHENYALCRMNLCKSEYLVADLTETRITFLFFRLHWSWSCCLHTVARAALLRPVF